MNIFKFYEYFQSKKEVAEVQASESRKRMRDIVKAHKGGNVIVEEATSKVAQVINGKWIDIAIVWRFRFLFDYNAPFVHITEKSTETGMLLQDLPSRPISDLHSVEVQNDVAFKSDSKLLSYFMSWVSLLYFLLISLFLFQKYLQRHLSTVIVMPALLPYLA